MRGKLALVLIVLALVALVMPSAALAVSAANGGAGAPPAKNDNRMDPATKAQADLKAKAIEAKLNGKAKGKVKMVANGQYVELAREGQDPVWTLLGEFSDVKHNQIAKPDRKFDNTTIWEPDFSRDFFNKLLYSQKAGDNSMANYYIEQSSGRYSVTGDAQGWVEAEGTEADYGANKPNGDDIDPWGFLKSSLNDWYAKQVAAGKTDAEINAYLKQFDVWDRYDYDYDGNFNEPDGYIDRFQMVHAGEDEAAGAGDNKIWSHSWYAYYQDMGATGPAFNPMGGIHIGNSDYWVGKYTIQPENGGVGVFVHEFGHDLGLPDLYDYFGENGTGFWTLMSSGSWLDDGKETIGNKSSHMGIWEKFQLGWANYAVGRAGKTQDFKLGPMEANTKQAQGLFVILPKKPVTSHIADPFEGSSFYFSGSADDLNNRMYKSFTLPAAATLSAKVNYGIEEGYDYASVIVSTDAGATWQMIPTNLSNSTISGNPNGIEGFSEGWVDLTADLPAGNVMVGFQYTSDGGVSEAGFMIDNIQITGQPLDGAETDAGWTYAQTGPNKSVGFKVTSGTESKLYSQYYAAEYRRYYGYDKTLKVGPYFFGYLDNPRTAELGRPLPVPGRLADQLLGHVPGGQQHRQAPRSGPASCRSTPIPRRSSAWTARSGATASRPTTPRSG